MMIVKSMLTVAAAAATLTLAAAAPALADPDSGDGAQKEPCTVISDSASGIIVSPPNGKVYFQNLNCRYSGPAQGGGALVVECSEYFDATVKLVAPRRAVTLIILGVTANTRSHCKLLLLM